MKYVECRKLVALMTALPLIAACDLLEREQPEPNAYTPSGYGVISPDAWTHDDFTDDQVFLWVDARINEWIGTRMDEFGEGYLEMVSYDTVYELVDDCRFFTTSSPTFYANGSHSGEGPHFIKACLYAKAESEAAPEGVPYPEMGPWYMNGLWKWGVFPADGVGFAVIPHELDHAIGIDHD